MNKEFIQNEQTNTSIGTGSDDESSPTELTQLTGLTRLSDDSVAEVYSFLNVAEYHNLSVCNVRFLQLTKTRLTKISPQYVQVKRLLPKAEPMDSNRFTPSEVTKLAKADANRIAERKFAIGLRPRVLKIDGEMTTDITDVCEMLKKIAPTLESLYLPDANHAQPHFLKMHKLTTLHLETCSEGLILEDLPASLTSLSIDKEVCTKNRCPFHCDYWTLGEENRLRGGVFKSSNGLQLAKNLTELNLPSYSSFFIPPTECTNLIKLTFEVCLGQRQLQIMTALSSFPKLTELNLVMTAQQPSEHLHLLSQISTLRQLKLVVISSYVNLGEDIGVTIVEQLRKITQLTSLHLLSLKNGGRPYPLDVESIFKHPHTLINLRELKVDSNAVKYIKSDINGDDDDEKPITSNLNNLNSLCGQLTSFGCLNGITIPHIDNLTHLDLSSQSIYPQWTPRNTKKLDIDGNYVYDRTICTVQKYASTIQQVIVPNFPTVHETLQTQFVAALCACPLLRQVFLPATWENKDTASIRQSFVDQIHKLRPDIQLQCQ